MKKSSKPDSAGKRQPVRDADLDKIQGGAAGARKTTTTSWTDPEPQPWVDPEPDPRSPRK
jgi:hypothetical protein